MGSKRSGKPRYNAEVHATIVKHLRAGAFLTHAAEAAGVSYKAVKDWVDRGLEGDKRYARFACEVRKVQAEDAVRSQSVITRAQLEGDWKAAAWSLERKYPKLYGRAAEPAVGVTIGPANSDDEGASSTRTRVEFYLPSNGRRPDEEP